MANIAVAGPYGSTEVNAAIAAASSGDTVILPACTVSWSSQVAIPSSKNITLQGAGIGQTVVTVGVNNCVTMSVSRITGFTFIIVGYSNGNILVATGQGFRIDHCRFEYTASSGNGQYGVTAQGTSILLPPIGLVDNCEFLNLKVFVRGFLDDVFSRSGNIWAAPLNLGGSNFVFIEDSSFVYTTFGNAIDSNDSSRYVFRHNDVQDTWVEAHSGSPVRRGSRAWEVYENTIRRVSKTVQEPILLRNGTGVCCNNVISGTFSRGKISVDNRRSTPNDTFGTQANGAYGGNVIDGNTLLTDDSFYVFTGTHNGSTSTTTLTDTTQTWPANRFKITQTISPFGDRWYEVYNLTTGAKGQISASTATTITVTLSGGTRNNWMAGDVYQISDGYPARDQIGRSTDAYLWTPETPNPPQASDPAYFWGNNKAGIWYQVGVINGNYRHVKGGRDYIDSASTPKPGYVPYIYPHPLRDEIPPPVGKIISVTGSLSFGDQYVNSTSTQSFTITNIGDTTLTVTSITYPLGFTGAFSGTIAPGVSQSVTVTFAPTSIGSYGGAVTVNSDATGSNSLLASGTGIALLIGRIINLQGGPLDFGNVIVNSSRQKPILIRNLGDTALNVSGITYPPSGVFSGAYSGAIAPGGLHLLFVTFSPTDVISYSGAMVVNSDAGSGINTIQLSGVGVAQGGGGSGGSGSNKARPTAILRR